MKKTPLLSLSSVALGAALLLTACGKSEAAASSALPPAISVESAEVAPRPMPRSLPLSGSLIANQQSEVAANSSGRVLKTFVERGDNVKEGAVLVQLDNVGAHFGEVEAQANLRNAQTQLELANTECKRNQALFDKGAISREEYERAASQCQTSSGSAEAAKARSEIAQKSLRDSTVRAPFAGMVGDRYVSVGEYVQASSKVVALVQLDPLRLQLTVGEADVGQIHEGQDVAFSVNAFPGETFHGAIKYIDPTIRSSTRDQVVEAQVVNTDHRLRPGMFATAKLELKEEPIAVVPKKSLVDEVDTHRLFAVVNGRIEERIVQTGPEKDGFVAVVEGVRVGDKIVINPSPEVKDGVPVK